MRLLPALALLSLTSWACRAQAPRGELPAPPDPSTELQGDVEVERELETLNIRTTSSGRESMLQLDLRNRSSGALSFAWTVEWYDRAGKRIAGSARAWTLMTLDAGASRPIQVPMPSPDATSWRLRAVRPG